MAEPHIHTRPAAVAGLFYNDNPQQLKQDIKHYLDQAEQLQRKAGADSDNHPPVRAIIAPHAGYIYSGPVAASAYTQLIPWANTMQRVVLLGPSHRVALSGMATPNADYFQTPLGNISISQPMCQQAESLAFVQPSNLAHQQEHSLEVHLPFLQYVLGDFELLPLVVGECPAQQVVDLLELFWGDPHTLVVISSDLSHYHDYASAQQLDRQTSQAIENLQPEKIHYESACGRNPLNGLLALARNKQLQIETLDLRNSGDTAGSKDRVVGYGAYVLH